MFIFFCAVIVLFCLFGILKKLGKKYYKDVALYENEEVFLRKIEELSKRLSAPEPSGKGIDVAPIKSAIKKGCKVISKKVKKGKEVYPFEKLLYENEKNILKIFEENNFDFFDLPHNNEPRALIFARACVAMNFGCVTKDAVEKAFDTFIKERAFTFSEAENMPAVFKVALLEKIAVVYDKARCLDKMNRLSRASERVVKKYINNNIFMSFVEKNNKKCYFKIKNVIASGEDIADDLQIFSEFVTENNILTNNLIDSLSAVDCALDGLYKRLPVYAVAMTDCEFSLSSETSKKECLSLVLTKSDEINILEDEYIKRAMKFSKNGLIGGLFSSDKTLFKSIEKDKPLLKKPRKIDKSALYIFAFFVVLSGLCAVSYFAFDKLYLQIISVVIAMFAFSDVAYILTNKAFLAILPKKPVFSRNYEKIPSEYKTDVVVPVCIYDENDIRRAVEYLRQVFDFNCDENATFTLLIDLNICDESVNDEKILSLPYFEVPSFLRVAVKKHENKKGEQSEKARKLNAVKDYADFLYFENPDKFLRLIGFQNADKPKYFITLDLFDELDQKGVLRAVNEFSHAENQKYDCLSFIEKTNKRSLSSAFLRFIYGGEEDENRADFQSLFHCIFRKNISTGKRIYDLEKFVVKNEDNIKNVPSAEFIEAKLLDSGASGVSVYERAPKNIKAVFSEKDAKKRNAVKLLPFVNFTIKNENNKKINKFIDFLTVINGIIVLSAPCFFALIILGVVFGKLWGVAYFLTLFFIKTVLVLLCGFFEVFVDNRPKKYLKNLIKVFLSDLFSLLTLPYFALKNTIIFCAEIRHAVSEKRLLKKPEKSKLKKTKKQKPRNDKKVKNSLQ